MLVFLSLLSSICNCNEKEFCCGDECIPIGHECCQDGDNYTKCTTKCIKVSTNLTKCVSESSYETCYVNDALILVYCILPFVAITLICFLFKVCFVPKRRWSWVETILTLIQNCGIGLTIAASYCTASTPDIFGIWLGLGIGLYFISLQLSLKNLSSKLSLW